MTSLLLRRFFSSHCSLAVLLLVFAGALGLLAADRPASPPVKRTGPQNQGREFVAARWWEKASAIARLSLRSDREMEQLSLDPTVAARQFDQMKAEGIQAVEVFAPAYGGRSYSGLDSIDRYRLDPAIGTMEDFRRLVRLAHERGIAIISFDNLGYSSVEAVDFLKACDDTKAGKRSREVEYFLWADTAGDPPPASSAIPDSFFMVRPKHLPGYDSSRHEIWQRSERAGRFYWSKWGGEDLKGNRVRLPQYNWGAPAFQEEAERVVRFWMDTGIDGMIIDAVNWYVGYTWELGRQRITRVIGGYGNAFSQPEGAGGFHEDPAAWVSEGGWNCVQDYGLGIWWEKDNNVVRAAIQTGNPRGIERALRDYHDRVVAAGGTLYFPPPKFDEIEKQRLSLAVVALVGDLVAWDGAKLGQKQDAEVTWLLRTKAEHPALYQLSTRRQLPTADDDKHYAFVKTSRDGSERLLVMLNFQPSSQTVAVDLSGVATSGLVDIRTRAAFTRSIPFEAELGPLGYRVFQLKPSDERQR